MIRILACCFALLAGSTVFAGEAAIERVVFTRSGADTWRVDVTLRHADTGWDHYADAWQVEDAQGNVLGKRVLFHPHVEEQPFTRSLGGLKIPAGQQRVWVAAHDKVHGWAKQRVAVDLTRSKGERYTVRH